MSTLPYTDSGTPNPTAGGTFTAPYTRGDAVNLAFLEERVIRTRVNLEGININIIPIGKSFGYISVYVSGVQSGQPGIRSDFCRGSTGRTSVPYNCKPLPQ